MDISLLPHRGTRYTRSVDPDSAESLPAWTQGEADIPCRVDTARPRPRHSPTGNRWEMVTPIFFLAGAPVQVGDAFVVQGERLRLTKVQPMTGMGPGVSHIEAQAESLREALPDG